MFNLCVQPGAFFELGKYKIKRCKVKKYKIVVREKTYHELHIIVSVSVLSMAIFLVHTKGSEIEEAPISFLKTHLV